MGEQGSSAVELENSHVQIISAFLPLRSVKPLGIRCLPTPHPPLTLPIFNPATALFHSPSVLSQELPWVPFPRLATSVCCYSALKWFLPFISGACKDGDGGGAAHRNTSLDLLSGPCMLPISNR